MKALNLVRNIHDGVDTHGNVRHTGLFEVFVLEALEFRLDIRLDIVG